VGGGRAHRRKNALDDTERGDWTTRTLFYGFIYAIGFVEALYFAA
jgi:hypothetical protein